MGRARARSRAFARGSARRASARSRDDGRGGRVARAARDGDDARAARASAGARTRTCERERDATAGTSRTATRSACAFVARAQALAAELLRLGENAPRALSARGLEVREGVV